MSEKDNKGVIYYKLEERYDNDITKYCGLTPGEVDSNIHFLRGKDIESISWDSYNHNLTLKRFNGELLKVDEVISVIEQEDKGIFSNDSLTGNGLVNNPLKLSDTLKTGFYAPVESFIDLTKKENSLPLNPSYGTRILTKENINPYGLLYNYKGVERIKEILESESSLWRIPTDEEWGEMLNAIELSDDNRNHLTDISNTLYGGIAGATLKKGCYKWSLIKISDESIETSLKVEKLQDPTYIEYYNTLDENIFYEVEVNENGSKKYYQYKCVNIWVESDETTQQKDILTSYDFNVLPCGFADSLNYSNVKSFGKWAGFWSSTPIPSSDIWVRQFLYNSDKVLKQSESRNAFFSVRLVRDYNDSVSPIEIINDIPYNTVLMPYLKIDPNSGKVIEGKKVWTTTNVSFLSVLNDKRQINAIEVKDSEGKELPSTQYFFLNYWNGEYWEKRQLKNNSMLIIGNGPDGSLNEEWQFINGELYKRSQEIIDALEEYTDEKISILSKKHDTDVSDINKKVNSNKEECDNSFLNLNNKIDEEIGRATSKENELFLNINDVGTNLNEEIEERKTNDIYHNAQIENLNENLILEKNERILNDDELSKRIDSVDKKFTDETNNINDVISLLNSNLNEETNNRENSDNVLSEEITKNKIISIKTPNNSIESTINESDNGTTISIDVLLDDSSCEFLRHTNAGITDVGIKSFVEEVKDNLINTYDEKIDEVSTKLYTEIENRYNSIENVNNEIDELKSQNTEEHGDFDKRLVLIENDYLKNSDKDELSREILNVNTTINNRIDNINNDITSNDGDFVEVRLTQVNGKINKITVKENDIAKSSDLSELKERIDTFFKSANLSGDTIDTLIEIQDYINSDASAAAEMTLNIKAAKDAADAAQADVDALEGVVATKAAQSDLNALSERVTTAEGEIDALQTSLAEGGATAQAIKATKDAADAAQADVDALEGVVATKAAQSDLTALAGRVTTAEVDVDNLAIITDSISDRVEIIENSYARNTDLKIEVERAKTSEENILNELNSVKTLVGPTNVNEQIENKINTLDYTDIYEQDTFVSEVEQKNGKIEVGHTLFAATPTISSIINDVKNLKDDTYSKKETDSKFVSNDRIVNDLGNNDTLLISQKSISLIIDDLYKKLENNNTNNGELSDVYEKIEILKKELNEIKSIIEENELVTSSALTNLKLEVIDINDNVNNITNNIYEVDNKVSEIKSIIKDNELVTAGALTNLESEIFDLYDNIEDSTAQFNNITNKINTKIDNKVSEIKSIIKDNELVTAGALTNLESEIKKVITIDNLHEYVVTPSDENNIVITKNDNGSISIRLMSINNNNF